MNLTHNLRIQLGAPANSVEGIVENIEEPLLKTCLSFPVKSCGLGCSD